MRNKYRLSTLVSLVLQPIALYARHLQRRRAVWFPECHSVEQEEPRTGAAGEQHHGLVVAPSCFGDYPSLSSAGFH